MSATMSSDLPKFCTRFLKRFLGRFPVNNIWFVAYPFFKIYKVTGFCPVQICLDKYPDVGFQRDWKYVILTVFTIIGVVAGFACGVHGLSHLETIGLYKSSTIISFITSWAQIFSLFFLGGVSVVSSWTNLSKMNSVLVKIRQIDYTLELTGAVISYRPLRKKLFIQYGVSLVMPLCLSMVNCIMIKSPFRASGSCYWFICFTPILLITMKELKFYNLMFLLKNKFDAVNQLIAGLCENRMSQSGSTSVISKCSDEGVVLVRKEGKLIDQIRTLAEIYSNTADCVDDVLAIFSCHLLMTTCGSFAVITIQSYNLFALVVHSMTMQIYEIMFTVAWIVVQVMVIGVNVIACSQISNSMAETGVHLHKLKPRDDYGMSLQMVQVFSLEILHRRRPLTAAGFFDMNFKLLTSIVAAVTTYLIIIIQFHLANLQLHQQRNQTRP